MISDSGAMAGSSWKPSSNRQILVDNAIAQINFDYPDFRHDSYRLSFLGYKTDRAALLYYYDRQERCDYEELEEAYPIFVIENSSHMGEKFIRKHFSGNGDDHVDAVIAHIQTDSRFFPLYRNIMKFRKVYNGDGRICDKYDGIGAVQSFLKHLSPDESEVGHARHFGQLKHVRDNMKSDGTVLNLNIIPMSGFYYTGEM
jgi:hypothetical protein